MQRLAVVGIGVAALIAATGGAVAAVAAPNDSAQAFPPLEPKACTSQYTVGGTSTYAQGGGEETPEQALTFAGNAISRSGIADLTPTKITNVEGHVDLAQARFLDKDNKVQGQVTLALVDNRWQIRDIVSCSPVPLATTE
jgi:hypothetical protein